MSNPEPRLHTPDPSLPKHGQPQKETPFEDEQAQAPQTLEVQSPQEAYVAKVTRAFPKDPPQSAAGLFL
jgi:hypothetical protein